tara:strand:- start:568 stop:705 length:138 start_codon:yes stop_codon:yes gene_type:complete
MYKEIKEILSTSLIWNDLSTLEQERIVMKLIEIIKEEQSKVSSKS